MRIGIFTDHFYPELGGIQDSLEELSRELGRRGHIVHLWAPRASDNDFQILGRERSEIQLGETVTIHRIPSLHFPMSPTRQSRIAIPYILPARDAFEACEVIHTNSFFGIGFTVLRAARRHNKPLVGTNHWAFAEFGDYFPPLLGALFNKAALAYVNWYYGRCDYMTAPGISTVNEQTNSGFTTPHEAISNPIDTDTYRPATHDERERLREKFGFTGPIITCVGRLAIEKKNDIVMRAFGIVAQSHPDARLVFAGHGTFEPTLRAIARELGIEDKVLFLGTLQKSALADLFRASDIYAIASTSETQSMSLLQAFATALPTVGVNWRAIPDYLSLERGFLFPKDDYAAMAAHITTLIEQPDLREKIGRAAHAHAQQFGIRAVVDRWEQIYAKTIALHTH